MAVVSRPRANGFSNQRLLLGFLIVVAMLSILVTNSNFSQWRSQIGGFEGQIVTAPHVFSGNKAIQTVETASISLPMYTNISMELRKRNGLRPRNQDLFPVLRKDHIIIVLYVHNRPRYFKVVVDALSKVEGINETLLIVSHDGFFPEMNEIVDNIRFCQVKQIFAPFSPHLFPNSFPGTSPNDCRDRDDPAEKKCEGQADQYGNHRSPRIVSLKHHWWWMMNTVWDGLRETRGYNKHIVFIEEDHYLYPNAYRNLQMLCKIKTKKCPDCWAVNLAPWDIKSRGEKGEYLVTEKIGNMGYAFNRTFWNKLLSSTNKFCRFDDYNWDITLWAAVYTSWNEKAYTLRGPRTSAVHFGRCGLHQGHKEGQPDCQDFTRETPQVDPLDQVMNINPEWEIGYRHSYSGYPNTFTGWGGWGDSRDHKLCMDFASMYRSGSNDNNNKSESL